MLKPSEKRRKEQERGTKIEHVGIVFVKRHSHDQNSGQWQSFNLWTDEYYSRDNLGESTDDLTRYLEFRRIINPKWVDEVSGTELIPYRQVYEQIPGSTRYQVTNLFVDPDTDEPFFALVHECESDDLSEWPEYGQKSFEIEGRLIWRDTHA